MLAVASVLVFAEAGHAQSPVGTVTIPTPDNNAYSTSLRYDSSGNLYAWDGLSVWEQSAGGGTFSNIGSVPAGNSADAGPISFSQDGQTLLLSNGDGGQLDGSYNGLFFTMSTSGGMGVQVPGSGTPYATDALALSTSSTIAGSSTKYLVYQASAFTGHPVPISISVFDAAAGTNQVVIDGEMGASASIAINPQNGSLYVNVGLGPDRGNIYSFSLSQIDTAYQSRNPLDFHSAGVLFNPSGTGGQIGAGMFFDKYGYLFAGGYGITVFRPDGTICYNQPGDGYYGYASLTYNPATNSVLKIPSVAYGTTSTGIVYSATDFESPSPGTWTSTGTLASWNEAGNWSLATVPSSGTVTFAPTLAAGPTTVTLDGSQTAAGLVFDVAGANGYTVSQGTGGTLTLGTSAGASIMVVCGANTISAPLVLGGSLSVAIYNGGQLQLADISQVAGASPALTLSGDGELVLSGTSGLSGGANRSGRNPGIAGFRHPAPTDRP